jgi:hypothetical protein
VQVPTQQQHQQQPGLQERTSQTQQIQQEHLVSLQQHQPLLKGNTMDPAALNAGALEQQQQVLIQHHLQPQQATSQQQQQILIQHHLQPQQATSQQQQQVLIQHHLQAQQATSQQQQQQVLQQQQGLEQLQQQSQQHQHIVVSQLSGIPAGSLLRALADAGHNLVVQQGPQQAQQQQQQVPQHVQIHLQMPQHQQQQQPQQLHYQQPQQHIVIQQDPGAMPGSFMQGNYTILNANGNQSAMGAPQMITSGFTLSGAPFNGSGAGGALPQTISLPNGTFMATSAGTAMGNTMGGQYMTSSGPTTSFQLPQQQAVVQYPTVIQNQDGTQIVLIPGPQQHAGNNGRTWSLVQPAGTTDGMPGQLHGQPHVMHMSNNMMPKSVHQQPAGILHPFMQQSHMASPTTQTVPQQQPFQPQHQHILINGPSQGGALQGGAVSQGTLLQPGQFMYGARGGVLEQAGTGNTSNGAVPLNPLNLAGAGASTNAALVATLLQQGNGASGHSSHFPGANNITLLKPEQEAALATRLSNESTISLPSLPSMTVGPAHRELAMRLSRGAGAGVLGGPAGAGSPLIESLLLHAQQHPQLQKQAMFLNAAGQSGGSDIPSGLGSGSSWLQQYTEERALCNRLSDSLLLTFGGQPLAPTAAGLPM